MKYSLTPDDIPPMTEAFLARVRGAKAALRRGDDREDLRREHGSIVMAEVEKQIAKEDAPRVDRWHRTWLT